MITNFLIKVLFLVLLKIQRKELIIMSSVAKGKRLFKSLKSLLEVHDKFTPLELIQQLKAISQDYEKKIENAPWRFTRIPQFFEDLKLMNPKKCAEKYGLTLAGVKYHRDKHGLPTQRELRKELLLRELGKLKGSSV